MKYYLGGYYLIRAKPLEFGVLKNKISWTCSQCINYSLYDVQCLKWVNERWDKNKLNSLEIDEETFDNIQIWTEEKGINFGNSLNDLSLIIEYKNKFFNHLKDIEIQSLYFDEIQAELLISTQSDKYNNHGNFDLRLNLMQKNEESNDNIEEFVGYDLIGVECDGSFHSFHCSNISKELRNKYNLILNKNGLYDKVNDYKEIGEFINDEKSGLEPLSYYIVKVKRIKACNKAQNVNSR